VSDNGPGQRLIHQVRLTANSLTVPILSEFHVDAAEALYVYQPAAVALVDFSADYRARRSE
jgi:hypothetical protein